MNQNIPAPEPEPEQQQLSGETAACHCQLSVQGTKQLCLQCPQVISYIIQGSGDKLARCIASYYECAASLNAVCNVVLGEKSGIMWHYKQYNPV